MMDFFFVVSQPHYFLKREKEFIANFIALYFLCKKETNGSYEQKSSTTRI